MSQRAVAPLLAPENEEEWSILWTLADRLQELGYTEENVSRGMGIADFTVRNINCWPAHVRSARRQRDENPAAILAAFFQMEELLTEEELRALLGSEAFDLLRDLRWIADFDGKHFFRYYLFPAGGAVILTDGHQSNPNHLDQVYALGSDSYTLARLAPRFRVEKSLDHCTGSGVQAVLGGSHCQQGFGVDINPRALAFARLNAKWNRQSHLRFLESDCYTQVTSESTGVEPCRFDLITANPPFVPTPEVIALCRGGGVSGEEITERIIRGLPEKLEPNGIFSMVTQMPVIEGQSFFQRCENWLESDETWSIVVLNNHFFAPHAYILGHMPSTAQFEYGEVFQKWLHAYESAGITGVTSSQVFVFRSQHPWRVERMVTYPDKAHSDQVESYLRTLQTAVDDRETSFVRNPGLETIWWGEGKRRAYLQWDEAHTWWHPEGLWLEGGLLKTLARAEDGEPISYQNADATDLRELLGANVLVASTPS